MKTIVFTGGGTGGHIYPGLAIADNLKQSSNSISIVWIGSNNGKDKKMVLSDVSKDGIKTCDRFIGIPSGKLRRYISFQNFIDIFKIFFGFIASVFILAKIKPVIVFSKGGFVSVPPCMAAKLLKIPVYTHECDFSPGLATKLNARFAHKILLSYEETKNFFSDTNKVKSIVTGNPVRDVFWHTDKKIGLNFLGIDKYKKPILAVLGGSSGAHQINNLIFENLNWFLERFTLVHQTGPGEDYKKALEEKETIKDKDSFYAPFDFIYSEMPHVLSCADIVLSRSGANSLWECASLGKPMVLIPLAGSGTRGDQIENARHFEKAGAAVVIDSLEKDALVFSGNVKSALELMLESDLLETMRQASKALVLKNPSRTIAKIILDEIKG